MISGFKAKLHVYQQRQKLWRVTQRVIVVVSIEGLGRLLGED